MWVNVRIKVGDKLLGFLRKEPKDKHIKIDSEEIYKWMLDQGIEIGEGDLDHHFNQLKKIGKIRGRGFTDAEGRKTHGSFEITWISPSL